MNAEGFHGEPVVGALGARTFGFTSKGLRPVMYPSSNVWQTSHAEMECGAVGMANGHDQPECWCPYCVAHERELFPDSCKHGLWSLHTIQLVAEQYSTCATHILGVIEPYGPGLQGSQGYRSQFATILALWVNPITVPVAMRELLWRQYPDVTMFETVAELLDAYPSLDDGTGVEGYRRALTPRTIHMGHTMTIAAIR